MTKRKIIASFLMVLGLTAVGLALARTHIRKMIRQPIVSKTFVQNQSPKEQQQTPPRALSRQEDAFNMARRLGTRFRAAKRETSNLSGTLLVGSDRLEIQTKRTQIDDGEQVEIRISGAGEKLTWDAGEGSLTAGKQPSDRERDLIEELVFDSPDQFVLAQLRGASYVTVGRFVRPENADERYEGPVWNIVRIHEPTKVNGKTPLSPWRLYYINIKSGLIDKVVSESRGQQVIASFAWTDVKGEKTPSQITWTTGGRTIMQFNLAAFTHSERSVRP